MSTSICPNGLYDSPTRKMENANMVLYVSVDGRIEIMKNRSGETGLLERKKITNILVQLLIRNMYNNTCNMFQEALKKDIDIVLKEHDILKGG
jgi:hypothetical protein